MFGGPGFGGPGFGGPRRPRRSGFGILFIPILIFAFAIDFISYGLYGFAEVLIPLLVFLGLGWGLTKLINGTKNNQTYSTNTYTTRSTNNTYNNNSNSYSLSVPDLNKIDKSLTKYFKNNINLPVIDGVALTTQSGKFVTADELYLTYKDEKITKLGDFKKNYPDVYKKIMDLLLVFSTKGDDVLSANVDTRTVEVKKEDKLSDADKYIEKINDLNDAIPQEEITNGLYQTCDLLKQIDVLSQTHNDNNKISKLYDYYLPILTGALEKYKKLQDAPVHGDEFKECEAGLIKTIVLINEALKTICTSMQEDDYMNINADVNTLQSLLKKDGYGNDPFEEKK